MITQKGIQRGIGTLSLMKFFPGDEDFRAALIELLGEMCHDDEQVLWLAKRMRNLYQEWPGAHELRAVLCARYIPRDGIEVNSAVYLDGVPSESEERQLQIEGPTLLALPPGHVASTDPESEKMVLDLSDQLAMPKIPKEIAKDRKYLEVEAQLRQLYGLGNGEV